MPQDVTTASVPWYRLLNREQWRVLLVSNLGWLFDGFEIYALFRHRLGDRGFRLGDRRRFSATSSPTIS